MKRFITALALACALSTPAVAGEIPSVGISSQGPNRTTQGTTSPGEIPSVGYTQLSDAALNLIQIMLGAGI